MSSRELYRRFLALCKKWPKDEQKPGRDYGEVLRKQFSEKFPQGELGAVESPIELDKSLSALERIANNIYYNENPLKRSSSTGLEVWAVREANSNETMKHMREEDEKTLFNRLKSLLSEPFSTQPSEKSNKDS